MLDGYEATQLCKADGTDCTTVTLSEVLTSGNTTGANNIVLSTTDEIRFYDNDTDQRLYASADGTLVLESTNFSINTGSWDISTAGAATGFASLTASGTVQGGTLSDGVATLNSGTLDLGTNTITDGSLTGNWSVGGTLTASTLAAGATDTVVTHSSGLLQTRTIDSRVWGSSLIDGSGIANYVARFSDTDTLTTGALYDNGTNVGLGTTSPVGKLHVQGAAIGKALVTLNETGDQNIFTASASGTTRFVIQNNGNVGIGTTTPTGKLSIYEDAPTADQRLFQVGTSGGANRFWVDEDGDAYFDNELSGRRTYLGSGVTGSPSYSFTTDTTTGMYRPVLNQLGLVTGSTERLRIDNSGNVGIGSTTPGIKLDVVGSARFSAVGSGSYSADLNLTSDGTLTTSSSDVRLKENFQEISDADTLSKVLSLKTYRFTWKDGGSSDIGMIAQEVDTLFPELTFTNKVDGYMGINYSRLPTLLVSAIQEQQVKLNSLALAIEANGQVSTQSGSNSGGTEAPTAPEWKDSVLVANKVWTFLQKVVFTVQAEFKSGVTFLSNVVFAGPVTFNKNTVGSFTVPSGATMVYVPFDTAFAATPTVYLSPQQQVDGGYQLEQVTREGFTIRFQQAQQASKEFNWLAVLSSGTEQAPVQVLESGTPSDQSEEEVETPNPSEFPTPTPSPTPSPSPTTVPDATDSADFDATEDASQAETASGSAQSP